MKDCVHPKTRLGFLWKQFAEKKQWDKGSKKSIMKMFPWRDESDDKRMTMKAERIITARDAAVSSQDCLKVGRRPLARKNKH